MNKRPAEIEPGFAWGCWLVGFLLTTVVVCGQDGDSNTTHEQLATVNLVEDIWDLTTIVPQTESSAVLRELVVWAMGLSDEQEAELRHLRIDMAEDLQWLHDQSGRQTLTDQGALVRYRAALEKYRTLRDSILTDAQLDLMERAQEQMARRPRKPFIGPSFPLVKVLEMDNNQQAQGHALLELYRQKLLALQESNAALDAADHAHAMAEMRQAFEGMLTPHQAQKLDNVRTAWQEYRQQQAELNYIIEAAVGETEADSRLISPVETEVDHGASGVVR